MPRRLPGRASGRARWLSRGATYRNASYRPRNGSRHGAIPEIRAVCHWRALPKCSLAPVCAVSLPSDSPTAATPLTENC